jgi:hypothetical protein
MENNKSHPPQNEVLGMLIAEYPEAQELYGLCVLQQRRPTAEEINRLKQMLLQNGFTQPDLDNFFGSSQTKTPPV